MSVFLPVTFLMYRALTKYTSNPWDSRIWKIGIQYTPVDSIATVVTWHSRSHWARAFKSAVKVGNTLTDCSVLPDGTQAEISRSPTSNPAAFRLIWDKLSNLGTFTAFDELQVGLPLVLTFLFIRSVVPQLYGIKFRPNDALIFASLLNGVSFQSHQCLNHSSLEPR